MSVQKLIASLCYIVCVLPTLNKTYLIWFEEIVSQNYERINISGQHDHDFTPKNHIFSNLRGGVGRVAPGATPPGSAPDSIFIYMYALYF
jgi:hypothetical protein